MSIAASLAALRREGNTIPQNPPNVHLTKLPLTSSLSDRAASARNALTLLSTADPVLATFEQDLHLSDSSFDRATLSPDSQQALISAITRITLRLTPVFLTRPCAAVLEWLLHTLQLPILGSAEEIDALMLCALPFHDTEQFLAVTRTLLQAPNAKKWRWLVKRAKTGSLVDTQFCVERAPLRVFKLIITRAVESVQEGVAVAPLAALVTNFVGRRMSSDDRPILTVHCVDALVGLYGASSKAEHLLCALLAALAAAMSYGLELEVAKTVASAAARCLSSSSASSTTTNTSIALLALCLRQHEECLSSKDAKMLLKMDKLQTALLCLGPSQSIDTYRDIIKCVITTSAPSERVLRLMEKSLQREQLLSAEATSYLVGTLLEACTKVTDDDSEKFVEERTAHLASLLTTLFKGSFSSAVDDVLHNHLVTRKVGKRHKKKFRMIDAALSKALDEIVSGNVTEENAEEANGSYPLAVDTLCLSHPDKKRRKHALESIRGREFVKEGTNELEVKRLVTRLKGMIQSERDLELVATALENVNRIPVHLVSPGVIRATLMRCRTKDVKDSEHSPERDKLALSLLGLCEKMSAEKSAIAPAVLLLLSFEGLLESCCEDNEGKQLIQRLIGRFGLPRRRKRQAGSGLSSLVSDVTEGIAQMILNETDHFSDLFSTVADIDEKWIRELSELWLKLLWAKLSAAETSSELGVVSRRILTLAKLHGSIAEELIRTLEKDSKLVLGTAESPKFERAVFVWGIASELINWQHQQAILTHLIGVIGLKQTIDILKSCSFDLSKSENARKRSLDWYINFCVVHPDDGIGKEAVVTASRIAYGDDTTMRVALQQIWSRRSELNRKKREKRCMLWDFLQLLSSLPGRGSRMNPDEGVTKLLIHELEEFTDELASRGGITMAPLRDASVGAPNRKAFEAHLASKLLCQELIQVGDLFLLRALGGSFFAGRDDLGKLYSLLESALLQCKDSDYSMVNVEAVYRLVMMVVSAGKASDPNLKARSLAKTIASMFKAISAASDLPNPILTTSLLCLMGFMITFTVPKRFPEKDLLIELLLAHGSLSSSTGACARRITNLIAGESITFEGLLHHVKNLTIARDLKSRRSTNRVLTINDDKAQLSTRAAQGAVRAIREWVGRVADEPQKIDLSLLQSSLCELWKLIKTVHEDDESESSTAGARDSEQLAVIISTLAILHRAVFTKDATTGQDVALEADFDALIGIAFTQESIDPLNDPALKFVRNTAHDLVGVLVTCQESGARHVLPKLLQSQTFAGKVSLITNLLERIMLTLISAKGNLPAVIEIVADAAYDESSRLPREARMKIMRTMLNGQSPTVGAFEITRSCLREVYNREGRISDPSTAAKECSWFLQEAQLACDEDIECMIYMENDVDCRITGVHFVNPEFLAKLGCLDDDVDAGKIPSVDDKMSRLFVVLLGLASKAEKDSAIRLLLASIPLSGIQLCACEALESEGLSLRIEALRYLGERIEAESLPLCPTWRSVSDESIISTKIQRESEASFLSVLGSKLCEVISMEGTSTEVIEMREVATDTLRLLSQRLGSASYAIVQEFASRISILSNENSDIIRSLSGEMDKGLILRGKVLECLASFTSTLARYSLPFIPHLLESSFAVLEEVCVPEKTDLPHPEKKSYKAFVYVTAASIKALTAILTSCPMFFGGKSLKRLILLALQTEVEAPRELLCELAAPEVPVDVFVSIFGNFASVDDEYLRKAPMTGLIGFVRSVSSGVSRMFKSEIKVNWQKILNVLLRSMDCARDVEVLFKEYEGIEKESRSVAMKQNGSISAPPPSSEQREARLEKCRELEIVCAEVLVKMVLKLSESEFEAVFKALLQWFDGGSLPDAAITACEDRGAEVEKNLPRTLPFFALMRELLSVLKTIMVPYFVQLITRMTTIIGRKIPTLTVSESGSKAGAADVAKKRSRAAAIDGESCSVLISEQTCLRETCMKLLASFFNLEFKEGIMNTRLAGELQEALLSAFDDLEGDSELVSKAMQGLARRMLIPGISNDAKKNQDMLIGLVRDVLSRTRDENAKLRAGALNTCRDMAVAVGDEFVSTLPESMPILAEVIDDEETAVSKAAERYVLLLESMTGEPILRQLK